MPGSGCEHTVCTRATSRRGERNNCNRCYFPESLHVSLSPVEGVINWLIHSLKAHKHCLNDAMCFFFIQFFNFTECQIQAVLIQHAENQTEECNCNGSSWFWRESRFNLFRIRRYPLVNGIFARRHGNGPELMSSANELLFCRRWMWSETNFWCDIEREYWSFWTIWMIRTIWTIWMTWIIRMNVLRLRTGFRSVVNSLNSRMMQEPSMNRVGYQWKVSSLAADRKILFILLGAYRRSIVDLPQSWNKCHEER